MNEDIYGSELYYYLDDEYFNNSVEKNTLRLDYLMDYFDNPGIFIILNRIDSTMPVVVSTIDSNYISTIISRTQ